MKMKHGIATLALVSLFALGACGDDDTSSADATAADQSQTPAGQAPPGMTGQEMDPEMMALMTEAQQLQQELSPIQQEAMESGNLASQLEELQTRVETAMREANPELFQQMDALEADFLAAQEEGDEARMQEVGMLAQGIQMQLQQAQQTLVDRPDIREAIDAFQEAQRAAMIEIDSDSERIMDRLDEIIQEMEVQ
ncbi:MAG: hypothetical protein WEA09_05550 [Gemmatimonadota bacterium]